MSKFNKIFEARESGEKTGRDAADEKIPNKTKKIVAGSSGASASKTEKNEPSEKKDVQLPPTDSPARDLSAAFESPLAKKRGRPQAKRSDPDYLGFTTYIRRDTHLKAKIALLQEGKGRELSELVEALLSDWLKSR